MYMKCMSTKLAIMLPFLNAKVGMWTQDLFIICEGLYVVEHHQ